MKGLMQVSSVDVVSRDEGKFRRYKRRSLGCLWKGRELMSFRVCVLVWSKHLVVIAEKAKNEKQSEPTERRGNLNQRSLELENGLLNDSPYESSRQP
jgi:hypothetical protein